MPTTSTSINALLNQIRKGELVLPDLQRDFVWKEDQIYLLLDSLMRDYPVGALLLWNTQYQELYYREFVRNCKEGQTHEPKLKPLNLPKKMVLDGQQRLQSLYLAAEGMFNGCRLYFKIDSDPNVLSSDDDDDEEGPSQGQNYTFKFWADTDTTRPQSFVLVEEIIGWQDRFEDDCIDRKIEEASLDGKKAKRSRRNLRRLRRLMSRSDLVPVEIIDEEVLNIDQARQTDEILDIFVRVNTGGTRLDGSELRFSLVKSHWPGARQAFDKMIGEINPSRKLPFDHDFILRGLLVMSGNPINDEMENIKRHCGAMQKNIRVFDSALKSTIDFYQDPDVGLRSVALLNPPSTLYPIVYFLSQFENASVPDSERIPLRTLLYFLLFNKFLLWRPNRENARFREMRKVFDACKKMLPLDDLLKVVSRMQKKHYVVTSKEMLQADPHLALNIAQPGVARDTLSWQSKLEIDHIFPQSVYRLRFPDLVDDIGNLAFLGSYRNKVKSSKHPSKYFAPIDNAKREELKDQFLIEDWDLVEGDHFIKFVEARREAIISKVRTFLAR